MKTFVMFGKSNNSFTSIKAITKLDAYMRFIIDEVCGITLTGDQLKQIQDNLCVGNPIFDYVDCEEDKS